MRERLRSYLTEGVPVLDAVLIFFVVSAIEITLVLLLLAGK